MKLGIQGFIQNTQFSISKALKTSCFHSMQINEKRKMGLNWVCKIDNGNQPNSTLETQAIVQNPQILRSKELLQPNQEEWK